MVTVLKSFFFAILFINYDIYTVWGFFFCCKVAQNTDGNILDIIKGGKKSHSYT